MKLIYLLSALALGGMLSACDGGKNCGAGTVLQGGNCVSVIEGCAPGTTLSNGQCVPACSPEQRWDGQNCVTRTSCGSGATLNETTGECVPDDGACAPGASLEGGICVPDVSCGEGTHLANGQCLPNTLPAPDILEASSPEESAAFTLPSSGQMISLGGKIDKPLDLNNDGIPEADWDAFAFNAQAGTYLRLTATSEGAALPAFMVISQAQDVNQRPLYARYGLNPNGLVVQREVYLPRSGTYLILVTDYNHMVTYLFGTPSFPVGGEDFTYHVTIENLGAPSVTEVGNLPLLADGTLTDGRLHFHRLLDLPKKAVLRLSSTGKVSAGEKSDLFTALTLFGQNGDPLKEISTTEPGGEAEIIHAVQEAGDFLMVQDFMLSIGPDMGYALKGIQVPVVNCMAEICTGGSIAENTAALLRWDLKEGDFFIFNATLPATHNGLMWANLLDHQLGTLSQGTASNSRNRWDEYYCQEDTWIYLWLEEYNESSLGEYYLEKGLWNVPLLPPGQATSALEVRNMPENTLNDAGIGRFTANAGQLAIFQSPTFHGAQCNWASPRESIFTSEMGYLGPVLDTTENGLPSLSPVMAYLPTNGQYLHLVDDRGGNTITECTYDTTLNLQGPVFLGALAPGAPLTAQGKSLDSRTGLAIFSYNATSGQQARIIVTPAMTATMKAQVQVLGFGYHYNTNWYWNAQRPELGLKAMATAASAGEAVTLTHTSNYEGLNLIIVKDAGSGISGEILDIEVKVTP